MLEVEERFRIGICICNLLYKSYDEWQAQTHTPVTREKEKEGDTRIYLSIYLSIYVSMYLRTSESSKIIYVCTYIIASVSEMCP